MEWKKVFHTLKLLNFSVAATRFLFWGSKTIMPRLLNLQKHPLWYFFFFSVTFTAVSKYVIYWSKTNLKPPQGNLCTAFKQRPTFTVWLSTSGSHPRFLTNTLIKPASKETPVDNTTLQTQYSVFWHKKKYHSRNIDGAVTGWGI